ncbi:MAG: hypothetical protein KDA96_18560 [Planctomycetaceae bacterium]|nr:hypothetical protein [Planctomycetaceae bacterium]
MKITKTPSRIVRPNQATALLESHGIILDRGRTVHPSGGNIATIPFEFPAFFGIFPVGLLDDCPQGYSG